MKIIHPHRRDGIATIELVMVWPLLLFLTVGVFFMARAGIAKEAAATKARAESYQQRPNAPTGEIFRLTHDPLASQAKGHHEFDVRGPHYFRGASFTAESYSFTIGRDWYSREVPFPRLGEFHIHVAVLKLIAKNIPGVGEAIAGSIDLYAKAFNPKENPALIALAFAGKILNPVVRAAGLYFRFLSGSLGIAKLPLYPAIAIAFASFQFGKARMLQRALRLINLVQRSFDNLDRASQGLPVENVTDLGDLRRP